MQNAGSPIGSPHESGDRTRFEAHNLASPVHRQRVAAATITP
jgi:hypothetical protein